MVATLLPALERVVRVTTRPSEKAALGQTVLKVNENRELTQLFTKRYLREQLLMVLAGREAEALLLGEQSTLNARNLGFARRIVNKLVVSSAMTDSAAIGPRTVSSVVMQERGRMQLVKSRVSAFTQASADVEMEALLAAAGAEVAALLARNRPLLDTIVARLCQAPHELSGDELRALTAELGNPEDLERRRQGQEIGPYI